MNIKIREYKPSQPPPVELTELLNLNYGNSNNFDYFYSDYNKSYSFCADNENVQFFPTAGYQGSKLKAHIALIVDKRLSVGEAFFGFLEIPNDKLVFEEIWGTLVNKARNKGVSTLKGPINGSIWHQYRCVSETNDSPYFKSELPSLPYYYTFLKSTKPSFEAKYYSASRLNYEIVLPMIKTGFEKLNALGFKIEEMTDINVAILNEIASVSRIVFHRNWGYTELNESEFLKLYSSDKVASHLSTLYLLYKGDSVIGFCITLKEDSKTIICKTICVLPEYQGLGLGNALAYKVHEGAQKTGIEKVIYALIRGGNQVKNFPKDNAVIFRRYSAFEYKI